MSCIEWTCSTVLESGPAKDSTWYSQAHYAAGTAFHVGVHEMDRPRWFAGSEARSVFMESTLTDPHQEVTDAVTVQVAFQNSALGASDMFTQAPPRYPIHHEIELFGAAGMVRSCDLDSLALTHFSADGAAFRPPPNRCCWLVRDAYALEQRLFFESIVNDTSVQLDPRESRAALDVAIGAVQSSATGLAPRWRAAYRRLTGSIGP